MRDLVVYVGGFVLPDRSASALRALGNAVVLREAGYRVLIAGKFAEIAAPASQPLLVGGFECHDIRQPLPGLRVMDYTRNPANIGALLRHLGEDRIATVIAYNYPLPGLARLIAMCKARGISVVNESTEWYGWEGFRPISNVRRIAGSRARNNSLAKRAGNFICSTRWSQARHPELNSLVLPFALDPTWDVWKAPADTAWCDSSTATRMVYSGSPGMGMYKDRLPWILEALDELAAGSRDFCFAIVGMTAQQYISDKPRHGPLLERLGKKVVFLGRLPHQQAVAILKSADLSVFVRRRNRVSTVGFPTKFAEAITCGVPVLTNDTSDIALYLEDGVNGILMAGCDAAQLRAGLVRALSLSREALHAMKRNVTRNNNPFAAEAWVPRMRDFMNNLRLPA
jgi:glycosyltransferase involved in cell wall biosynthesis